MSKNDSNNTLKSLKVGALSVFPSADDPSLAVLLLGEEVEETFETSTKPTITKKKSVNAASATSRKSRRSKASTAGTRVRAKRNSRTDGKTGVRTDTQRELLKFRQKTKRREKNAARLEAWQKKSSPPRGKKQQTQESNYRVETSGATTNTERAIEITAGTRPIVLGTFDFFPMFGDQGLSGDELTTTGKLIALTNAIKFLNLESAAIAFDSATQNNNFWEDMPTYDLAPLSAWFKLNKRFQTLLNVDVSGSDWIPVFDYLMLNTETADIASNTEVLMTVFRDLACALQGCSPRLLELDTREFSAGVDLPQNISNEAFSLKTSLADTDAFENIVTSLGDLDSDQLTKALIYTISNEHLLSINKGNQKITNKIDDLLEVSVGRETFLPSAKSALNCYNMVQYGGEGDQDILFAMEPTDIQPDNSVTYVSWPDIFRVLPFTHSDPKQATHATTKAGWDVDWSKVYPNLAEKSQKKISDIESLLDNSWVVDSAGAITAQYFSEFVALNILRPIDDILDAQGNSMDECSIETVVGMWWISMAASDTDLLRCLILFLADLYNATPTTQTASFTSASESMAADEASSSDTSSSDMSRTWSSQDAKTSSSKRRGRKTRDTSSNSSSDKISGASTKSKATIDRSDLRSRLMSSKEMANWFVTQLGVDKSEVYADMSLSTSAELYGSFLYNRILENVMSYAKAGVSDGHTLDAQNVDTDDIAKMLSEAASSGGFFSKILSGWDLLSEVSLNGNSAFSDTSGVLTSVYSGLPQTNLQIAYLVAAANVHKSILGSIFGVTSDATDDETVTIYWDGDALTAVKAAISDSLAGSTGRSIQTDAAASPYTATFMTNVTALKDEEESALAAPAVIKKYFYEVNSQYQTFSDTLDRAIGSGSDMLTSILGGRSDDQSGSGMRVGRALVNGLTVSSDSLAFLEAAISNKNFGPDMGWRWGAGGYSREMTVDQANNNWAGLDQFFAEGMDKIQSQEETPTKIMVIGLPTGFLDELEANPVALDSLSRQSNTINDMVFEVVLEKLDLVRDDVVYEEKVFQFPRKIIAQTSRFANPWVPGSAWKYNRATATSSAVDYQWDVFLGTNWGYGSKTSSDWTEESFYNKEVSSTLKLYLDTLYGVSTYLCDFPVREEVQKEIKSTKLSVPKMALSNGFDTDLILSQSCAAFVSDKVKKKWPTGFGWLSVSTSQFQLDMKKYPSNSEENALYTWVNTLSSYFDVNFFVDRLKHGVIFEDILCIPYNPHSFELDTTVAATTSPEAIAMARAEDEVGLGPETSEGIDAATFRVSIRFPNKGSV